MFFISFLPWKLRKFLKIVRWRLKPHFSIFAIVDDFLKAKCIKISIYLRQFLLSKNETFFKPCDFLFAWNFLPMWSPLISCEFTAFLESFWLDKFDTTTVKLTQRLCRLYRWLLVAMEVAIVVKQWSEKVKTLVCLRLRKNTGLPPH